MSPVYHLFVYGSLRSDCKSETHRYVSSYFTLVGKARVKGHLYDLGEYTAAVPTSENCFVTGELYHISSGNKEFLTAMEQLDDYEDVNGTGGGKALYKRKITDVLINGLTIPAWIYWYNDSIDGKPLIPSGDVSEHLKIIKTN